MWLKKTKNIKWKFALCGGSPAQIFFAPLWAIFKHFDSWVGRAVDCSCSMAVIHRSLVQIRLEGLLLKIVFRLASKDFDFSPGLGQGFAFSTSNKQEIFYAELLERYPWLGRLWLYELTILDSLVVRISACHVEGPGSIPGRGVNLLDMIHNDNQL